MADQTQTSTGLSVYGGLHKVLTLPLPATVLLAKFCNIPLSMTAFEMSKMWIIAQPHSE